jgi:alcohol dehydrogenase
MWEKNIDIDEIKEIRGKTTVYLGVGAISKIDDIAAGFAAKGMTSVLVVTGKAAYRKTGAWAVVEPAFASRGIKIALYDGATPNPEADQVDAAAALGAAAGVQAVVGIGGGSPIDTAKSAAILLANPGKTARDLYEFRFSPEKALPIVAINLTHGTGSEANRFAVVSIPEKQYKPAIAYDCIYPLYSIDDPALMAGLPAMQTICVSVDAVNHVVEAATSKAASPYSILLAEETIRLVAAYLPAAIADPSDLRARYFLAYAALIAGIAFDNGLLHFTHALEHPLSGMKSEVIHGQGLALLLPAVVRQIYAEKGATLAQVLAPIVPGLTGAPGEAAAAAAGIRKWLGAVGIAPGLETIGFVPADVARLTDLAMGTPSLGLLLSMAPTASDASVVRAIYAESFLN